MAARKECRRRRLPGKRNPVYDLIPQPEPLRSFHEASPPSITSSEMKIFAGFGTHAQIQRVRGKVRQFENSHKVFCTNLVEA